MFSRFDKQSMVSRDDALSGRQAPVAVPAVNVVLGHPMTPPWPAGHEVAYLAAGCFWGLERIYWRTPGVWTTAVGYMGGYTPNPTYEETCTARTGHAEAVIVVFDPAVVSYEALLKEFWENHDPTTLNRQGNDVGESYRSAIFFHSPQQEQTAREVIAEVNAEHLYARAIVTEVTAFSNFYPAEDYHQEYFAQNPSQGYCSFVVAPKVAKFRKQYAEQLK